jgi:tripartite-type tricarboxylate transporter receptor subunit TctC
VTRRHLLALSGAVLAGAWPDMATSGGFRDLLQRPIRIIVPFSAGTTLDVMGRALSVTLEPLIGQRPLLVNRDGAAGFIALSEMAQAEADGTTWLLSGPGQFTIQPHIRRRVAFTLDDFAPVCQIYETPFAIVASRQSGIASFADLIERARREPAAVSFGHYGPGSATHLLMAILARHAGVRFLEIPYRSQGQLVQDLLTGALQAAVLAPGSYDAEIVRHVAILAAERYPQQPGVPTIIELGQPLPLVSFAGIYVVKAVAPQVRLAIEAACILAANSALVRAVAARAHVKIETLPHAPFTRRILDQSRDMQAVIGALGLTID